MKFPTAVREFGCIVMLAVSAVVIWLALLHYLSLPVVEMSWSTKKCIRVTPPPYTCDYLPDTYETIWRR